MKIDFIFSEIMCLKHIDLLLNLFDNLLYRIFIGPSRNSIFMHPLDEAETFRLSILICRRVNTAVT